MREAGVPRGDVYVTNAVKHFKFKRDERGKRRIHQTPSRTEVVACRPWLLAELRLVEPELLVLLGSVAAKALLGPSSSSPSTAVSCCRLPDTERNTRVLATTTHPSAVLRASDRHAAFEALVADLRVLASAMDSHSRR